LKTKEIIMKNQNFRLLIDVINFGLFASRIFIDSNIILGLIIALLCTSFLLADKKKDYTLAIIGVFLMATGVTVFYQPASLVTGGITGLSLVLVEVFRANFGIEISLGLLNLLFNLPLLIIAYKLLGKSFLSRTIFATLLLSVALDITDMIPKYTETDFIIPAIFGGIICGLGVGLVVKAKATTGGTIILASMIHKFAKHFSLTKILFVTDSMILLAGLFVFGMRSSMYAIISLFVITKAADAILEGLSFSKAVFIITKHGPEISQKIFENIVRGATSFDAKGAYTQEDKDVLLIVMSSKELVAMKDIVKGIDENAFVIVTDVKEVLGKGFVELSS